MKTKKWTILFSVLISSIIIFLFIKNYHNSSKPIYDFPSLIEQKDLSKEDYLTDFNYAWDILEAYYPYFEVNKELSGTDFLSNKVEYQDYILKSTSDQDFYKRFNKVLENLNNHHVNLIPVEDGVDFYLTYRENFKSDYRSDFADLYENPIVQNRYRITNELIETHLSYYQGTNAENDSANANCQDLIPGQIAYLSIPDMISYDLESIEFKKDKERIESYLQNIKNYDALIIDIRGNGGGDSKYWQEFLLPLIFKEEISNLEYTFIKDGPLFKKVKTYDGYKKLDDKKLRSFNFPEDTLGHLEAFNYYAKYQKIVTPSQQSIKFQGNIYLLVDEMVYSSAEQLATFMKETKTATLIGETTGGDGIGSDPFQVSFPKSGFVMRFPKQMGVTGKGSINDLDKTKPDIAVHDGSIQYTYGENQININKDSCLEKVLELEDIR